MVFSCVFVALSCGAPGPEWCIVISISDLYLLFKGDSNPNDKYVLSERALLSMNFDTSIIKIGRKIRKLCAFKEFNMANI